MPLTQARYLDPVVVSQLKNLEFRARLIVEGFITGLHKSPYHGFSVEFAEHRAYNTGESPRTIDWKVYGRTERLYTKKFEEESNLRCTLVVDVSDSMRYPVGSFTKLSYAVHLAASLGYLLIRQRDAVGLAVYDDTLVSYLPPKARMSHLMALFAELEQLLGRQQLFTHGTATAATLHALAQKLGRRSLVVLLSDLLGEGQDHAALFTALQHLRHEKHEVLIFQLLDRATEQQFNFADGPLLLKDLETGQELRVQAQQVRAAYQQQTASYQAWLKARCSELHIHLVPVDIHTPYEKTLLDYMRMRQTLVRAA